MKKPNIDMSKLYALRRQTRAERLRSSIKQQKARNERLQARLVQKQEEAKLKEELRKVKSEESSLWKSLSDYGVRHISRRRIILVVCIVAFLWLAVKTCS